MKKSEREVTEWVKCSRCQVRKLRSEFRKDSGQPGGIEYQCKDCRKKGWHDYYDNASEKVINQKRMRLYGMTPETYEATLLAQNFSCMICKRHVSELSQRLSVDHDHSCCKGYQSQCGKCVRGLLCGDCNRGLGLFHESEDALLAAITYLRNNK